MFLIKFKVDYKCVPEHAISISIKEVLFMDYGFKKVIVSESELPSKISDLVYPYLLIYTEFSL